MSEQRWTIYACPECGEELGKGNGHTHADHVAYYAVPITVIPADQGVDRGGLEILALSREARSHLWRMMSGEVVPEEGCHLCAEIFAAVDAAVALDQLPVDLEGLVERLEQRVLRTPEPTSKQEALMEEFGDEMPAWGQLSFVQSEVERMREEIREAISEATRG